MSATPEEIAAAEARLAEVKAEAARLEDQLQAARDEQAAHGHAASEEDGENAVKPLQETTEDAIAEARRRGGKLRSEQEAERLAAEGRPSADAPASSDDGRGTTAADGIAAARARMGRRS